MDVCYSSASIPLESNDDDVEILSVVDSPTAGRGFLGRSGSLACVSRNKGTWEGRVFRVKDYTSWKLSVGLERDVKVFVVDSSMPDLKAALLSFGWVENIWDPGGPWFDLKWTIHINEVDYSSLRPPQMANHYERSLEFVTKAGLNSQLKAALESSASDVNAWYPRSFLLSGQEELDAFISEFKSRKAESVLRQWVEHIENGRSTSETFSEDLVHIALDVTERRVMDIDNLLATDDNEAEFYGFWVTEEESNVISLVDLDNPGKELQELRKLQCARIEEERLRKKRRRQAEEALERRTEELHKIRERFCRKSFRRAASVPGRAGERKDVQTPESPEKATMRGQMVPLATMPASPRDSVLAGQALFSRVCKVLDALRASDAQFTMAGSRNIWVLKPHGRARGEGIFLSSDLDEILHCGASQRFLSSWIVQKYIENPLLIRGRKHDLRQWVLVTSWNPLTIYFFSEAYIRQASEQFSLANIKNRAEHLTNLSVTKHHSQFDKFDEYWCCTWSQDTYRDFLSNEFGFDVWEERILPAMKHIVISTLQCVQGDLSESTGAACCFELFGFDFMVDDAFNVWLLEINASPSMAHDTPVHARLVPAVLRDSLRVAGLSGDEPEQSPSPPCFYRLDTGNLGPFSSHRQTDAMSGFIVQAKRLERPCPPPSSPTPVDLGERGRSSLQDYMEKVRRRQEKEQKRKATRQQVVERLRRAGKKAWKSTSMPALVRSGANQAVRDDGAECGSLDGLWVLAGMSKEEVCTSPHNCRPQALPALPPLVGRGLRDTTEKATP